MDKLLTNWRCDKKGSDEEDSSTSLSVEETREYSQDGIVIDDSGEESDGLEYKLGLYGKDSSKNLSTQKGCRPSQDAIVIEDSDEESEGAEYKIENEMTNLDISTEIESKSYISDSDDVIKSSRKLEQTFDSKSLDSIDSDEEDYINDSDIIRNVQKKKGHAVIKSDSESDSLSGTERKSAEESSSPESVINLEQSFEKINLSSETNGQNFDLKSLGLIDSDEIDGIGDVSRTVQKKKEHSVVDSVPEVETLLVATEKSKEDSSSESGTLKTDIADRIRVQQLLAEKKRIEFQISKSKEEIMKTKTTLRTVNLSVLPDKGMRLHTDLSRREASLRDLLIQEKIINENLQQFSNGLIMHVKQNHQGQPKEQDQPAWSKLASASVNINEMGKKALETHRAQQSVTMDALMRLHNSIKSCPTEEQETTDPNGLTVSLMPHQKHALAWLLWREGQKPRGGILADDMGLGKTLTMISLILKSREVIEASGTDKKTSEDEDSSEDVEETKSNWLSSASHKKYRGKTLIVCPATLIGQWEKEIEHRVQSGSLTVEMYHGPNREKREKRLARRDVVITTYTIVGRESGTGKQKTNDCKSCIFNIHWERVILDEAHQIRNHKSQAALGVYDLKAKYRWALTGTPIHNTELDLYSLLKFIRCSPFDDLAVWKRWVDNRDASGNQRLSTIVKALMLRRTKQDLQTKSSFTSLPEKKIATVEVKLNQDEFKVYQKILDFSKTLMAQFIEQKAERENYCGHMPVTKNKSRYRYEAVEDPFVDYPELARLHTRMKNMADLKTTDILVLLLRLRQICCHPYLIQAMINKDEIANAGIGDSEGLDVLLAEKMGNMSITDDEKDGSTVLTAHNPIFARDKISSKIESVLMILEKYVLGTDDKAIIVSQWTSMLELVHRVLQMKDIKCVLLTGSVPVKARGDIVEKFNKKSRGPKIMLLSLTAGGVGLNLVGANHLLIIDLHWNPQLETQACDRIYRLGQTKPVFIYKFLCVETIEERIQKLQQQKLIMAQNVLTGANIAQASKLSLEDLKMLFNMK